MNVTFAATDIGRFGRFGGRYVPETLMPALDELEEAYARLSGDPWFQRELRNALQFYCGRPTPLYYATRLSDELGVKVYIKREDLLHTGAHKINKPSVRPCWRGAWARAHHRRDRRGPARCRDRDRVRRSVGLPCEVYMGAEDIERQNAQRIPMRLLGREGIPVESGTRTLKDAINEAIRDWVTNVRTTYLRDRLGRGAAPLPDAWCATSSRSSAARPGSRSRSRRAPPRRLVACVGGGSNAMGLFYPFMET